MCFATYVVQETNAGRDINLLLVPRSGLAVEVDVNLNLRLVRLALNISSPGCHVSFQVIQW